MPPGIAPIYPGMDETAQPPDHALSEELANRIISEAAQVFFAGCRDRIVPFIDANFSIGGSARLHRHAIGWDLLKAPANVALSLPQIGLKLGALAARGVGLPRAARALGTRNLFLQTAVARELHWRMMVDLLRQPYADGERVSARDGLAEAILTHPDLQNLLQAAGSTTAAHRDDPAFRARLDAALTEYAGTRAAASEITTGLLALGGGAIAFNQLTPGAIALGPIIAASFAHGAAVASFPLGATAGGLWYGVFPAQASPILVGGTTAGVMGVAALASAFAGVISDPVQRATGLHRRRLQSLVSSLEKSFAAENDAGFVAYDLYVARLLDLSDVLLGIARAFRAG